MDNKILFYQTRSFPSSILKGVVMDRNNKVCLKLAKIQSLIHSSFFFFFFFSLQKSKD